MERLDNEKLVAVQEERYDDAKRIKLKVDNLLNAALRPAGTSEQNFKDIDDFD